MLLSICAGLCGYSCYVTFLVVVTKYLKQQLMEGRASLASQFKGTGQGKGGNRAVLTFGKSVRLIALAVRMQREMSAGTPLVFCCLLFIYGPQPMK